MCNVVNIIHSYWCTAENIVVCTLAGLTDKRQKRNNTQNVIRGYSLYFRQLYGSCLSIASTVDTVIRTFKADIYYAVSSKEKLSKDSTVLRYVDLVTYT